MFQPYFSHLLYIEIIYYDIGSFEYLHVHKLSHNKYVK